MKKSPILLFIVLTVCWFLPSCEKDVFDVSPTMEAYYIESEKLPSVTLDSVSAFKGKVNDFVTTYPEAKEHRRYEQILANIKAASLRMTIIINDEWAGDTLIHF